MPFCFHCGGDTSDPGHPANCDGRQGHVEATEPPPRNRYSHVLSVYQETSRAAWDSVWSQLPIVDASIVRVIVSHDGATSAEIEGVTGFKHQTVSAQIRHMVEAGLLIDSGERRRNDGQRRCIVWQLAEQESHATTS